MLAFQKIWELVCLPEFQLHIELTYRASCCFIDGCNNITAHLLLMESSGSSVVLGKIGYTDASQLVGEMTLFSLCRFYQGRLWWEIWKGHPVGKVKEEADSRLPRQVAGLPDHGVRTAGGSGLGPPGPQLLRGLRGDWQVDLGQDEGGGVHKGPGSVPGGGHCHPAQVVGAGA